MSRATDGGDRARDLPARLHHPVRLKISAVSTPALVSAAHRAEVWREHASGTAGSPAGGSNPSNARDMDGPTEDTEKL